MTTYSDESTTGRFSLALRGLARATIAARVDDPEGFEWIAKFRHRHLPDAKELKARDVLPLLGANPRLRDEILERTNNSTIVIVDVGTYQRDLVVTLAVRFGIQIPPGQDPLDVISSEPKAREFAEHIFRHARDYAIERSTVPRIRRLLEAAISDSEVPLGVGPELFDRAALREMDHREFERLLARFAVAFADALRPERQVDAILRAAEEARYVNPGRHAFLALEDALLPDRIYDHGPAEPFQMLQRAHRIIHAHMVASMHSHWVQGARAGRLEQDDSAKLLGLQAADVVVGLATEAFEIHGGETRAGAQNVRRMFSRVLLNDEWI
jgi:hypothetical protein